MRVAARAFGGRPHTIGAVLLQGWCICVLFRHRDLAHHVGMATIKEQIAAERTAREVLERAGLPAPDEVEYGYTCIRLLWHEAKVALVVEIDKPPGGDDCSQPGASGESLEAFGFDEEAA